MEWNDKHEAGIVSLTGLLVPVTRYADLRTAFYGVLQWVITPDEGVIAVAPRALHGRELLSWHEGASDELKWQTFEAVVDLVVGQGLEVYRGGYYRHRRMVEVFAGDAALLSLCWFGLLSVLQPRFADEPMIPVMEGFDRATVDAFSQMIRDCDIMRACGLGADISFDHTENILGEVFYADSRFSVLTQVADVVAYLRHITDKANQGKPLTPFQDRLREISAKLAPSVAREEIVWMRVHT